MQKSILLIFSSILCLTGCKEVKKTDQSEPKIELSILDKVANAHGFDHFKDVKEIAFIFNVDRDSSHFQRSWKWNIATNDIETLNDGKKFNYNRGNLDSISTKINAGFINDKYWLLAPFNLVWDKDNITYTQQTEIPAPISKKPMQKLTIVYGHEGGYTPGDAYDLYFGPDFIIREWVYRKGNQQEASLTTTWENYKDINGLKIAEMHQNEDRSFKLYFTDLQITPKHP